MMASLTETYMQSSKEEIEVLKRFAAGDVAAFEALFQQYQAQVYGWIVRIVRDRSAAEELTIDAFWRIYKARRHFDPERCFGAWARRIATNVAIDHLKTAPPQEFIPVAEITADGIDVDAREHLRRETERAFHELPAGYQAAATLALIEEQPYEEISEALGISVGAVKSRVFRAVRLLRKKLRRYGVAP